MFSSRIKWDLAPNRLARLILEKRARGEIILDLTESNPTRAGFDYPAKEILDALARPASMLYEPASRGLMVAREAVSNYYAEHGHSVDPDRIHLTASTSESYSYLFKLLTDFGQSVLIPHPSYPLFEFLAALEGVELRPFNLDYIHPSGWRVDFDSFERAIDAGTRAVILVNPNNPTGTFLKRDELERLNLICARHSLALIVDEVFSDYAFEDDGRRVASLVDNSEVLTFVLNGFSKVLALPQMKLGWIVTGGPRGAEAIERLDLIADTFLSVGAPVQHASATWLSLKSGIQDQIRNRVRRNYRLLAQRVEGSAVRLLAAEGGWYATLEVPRIHSEEEWVLRLLEKDGVLVHPGYFFDFPAEAFLVVSLLPSPEILDEAVDRILRLINEN